MFFTILLFFIYLWGFGFSVTYFIKKKYYSDSPLERLIMNTGIGMGVLTLLITVLPRLRIPIDWKLYLVLSLIVPGYAIYRHYKENNGLLIKEKLKDFFTIKKSTLFMIAAIILSSILLFTFVKGSFAYPWLEDGDPWEHAAGTFFVSEQKSYIRDLEVFDSMSIHYLEPYPPAYDSIMGLMRQTYKDTNWILKFFNPLMIALGHLWFFFLVKEFTKNQNIALFAAFALVMLPSFLSHFIWSTTLALILYFPAFYCIEKLRKNKKENIWLYASILMIASIMVAQPTDNVFFGMMFILYYGIHAIQKRKMYWRIFSAGALGFLLSLIVYWIPVFLKFGIEGMDKGMAITSSVSHSQAGGNWARLYTFRDFFIAPLQGMFDNPTGIGVFLFILGSLGIVFILYRYFSFVFSEKRLTSKKSAWLTIVIMWLIFGIIGTNSTRLLPVSLFPYRFWSKLAIPVAIVAAYGFVQIFDLLKKKKMSGLAFLFLIVAIAGVVWTSGYPKYSVNTSLWPAHNYYSQQEMFAHTALRSLPMNSPIYSLCYSTPFGMYEERIIGLGHHNIFWQENHWRDYKIQMFNQSAGNIYDFLKSEGYQYLLFDSACINDYGLNATNAKLEEMGSSGLFRSAIFEQPLIVLQLA